MKKILLVAAATACMLVANAQQTVEHTNFSDNWSLGVTGGVTTPLANHAFFGDMRGTFGLDLHKQISYVFGVGVEGSAAIYAGGRRGILFPEFSPGNASRLGKSTLNRPAAQRHCTRRFINFEKL